MAKLVTLLPLVLNCYLPLPEVLLPMSADDLGIELKISVQAPLFDGVLHVCENIRPAGIESLPVGIGVKWKSLHDICQSPCRKVGREEPGTDIDVRGDVALHARVVVGKPCPADISPGLKDSVLDNLPHFREPMLKLVGHEEA